MNLLAGEWFQNGDNDGDICIISEDNDIIKCHLIVLKKLTGYFNVLSDFEEKKNSISLLPTESANTNKNLTFKYSTKVIKLTFNKLYDFNYKLTNLDYHDIRACQKFIDEIDLKYIKDKFEQQLLELFKSQIDKENWIHLLDYTYQYEYIYSNYKEVIFNFFKNVILNCKGITEEDPIKDIDYNSKMGKDLIKLMRNKIEDLNEGYKNDIADMKKGHRIEIDELNNKLKVEKKRWRDFEL